MIQNGMNVYNTEEWLAIRQEQQTALHSENVFQYPLPLAVMMAPLGKLSINDAYIVWLFLGQLGIVISILLLLHLQLVQFPLLEIVLIGIAFLFRPMYTVILSGQILAVLLFSTTLALVCFHHQKWFLGGLLLSLLILKPSIGLPILLAAGLWFLANKSGKAILGCITGGIFLFFIGVSYNPGWVFDYLRAGEHLLTRYIGMHSTLWGLATLLFGHSFLTFLFMSISVGFIVLTLIQLFFIKKIDNSFAAMSVILPTGLLIAPYSWSYDQILLFIPIFFVMNEVSKRYGWWAGSFLLLCIVLLAALLALLAYQLLHDVWAVMVIITLWALAIYFTKNI